MTPQTEQKSAHRYCKKYYYSLPPFAIKQKTKERQWSSSTFYSARASILQTAAISIMIVPHQHYLEATLETRCPLAADHFQQQYSATKTRVTLCINHICDHSHHYPTIIKPHRKDKVPSTNSHFMAPIIEKTTHFRFSQQHLERIQVALWKQLCYRQPVTVRFSFSQQKAPRRLNAQKQHAITACHSKRWPSIVPPQNISQYRASLIFVNNIFILSVRQSCFVQDSSPKLKAATRQPLHTKDRIHLHVSFGSCCARVWLAIGLNVVVDMLYSYLLIDRSLRGIFVSKRKVAPQNSFLAVILYTQVRCKLPSILFAALTGGKEVSSYVEELPTSVRMTRKVVFKPQIYHCRSIVPFSILHIIVSADRCNWWNWWRSSSMVM